MINIADARYYVSRPRIMQKPDGCCGMGENDMEDIEPA